MRPYRLCVLAGRFSHRHVEILTEMTYGHFDYPLSAPSRAEGWLL